MCSISIVDDCVSKSPTKKRKAQPIVVSDSSDVEVTGPSSSKKRVRKSPPTPGTEEFELLPPVSILSILPSACTFLVFVNFLF